jgi:hypothetical protein
MFICLWPRSERDLFMGHYGWKQELPDILDESIQKKYSCHYASHDGYEIVVIYLHQSTLHGGGWSALHPSCFFPGDRASGTHKIWGCRGPTASMKVSNVGYYRYLKSTGTDSKPSTERLCKNSEPSPLEVTPNTPGNNVSHPQIFYYLSCYIFLNIHS